MNQPSLFDVNEEPPREVAPPDQAARVFAIDPANHVVLEASAGTGKTRVLVDRYVRLLEAGVDPKNILAMTFTRKAAAEMRARVLETLVERDALRAGLGSAGRSAKPGLMDRASDIEITTIDGFCFALLREFPLEADVDPAFEVADETEMARFVSQAIDRTLHVARHLADDDESVRLLLARVKAPVLAEAMGSLVDRRHVALPAVARFVHRQGTPASADEAARRFIGRLRDALSGELRQPILADGPLGAASFRRLAADLQALDADVVASPAHVRLFRRRVESYFLTRDGKPRQKVVKPYTVSDFPSPAAKRRHEEAVSRYSLHVAEALVALDRDVDVLLSRGVLRLLRVAVSTYESLLEEQGLLDFASMLEGAVALLERQEEFARSRLKLQARYHHLLIDEFQDTSRLQWRLIDLLIGAWAEGEGAADAATSVFVVGDRKQSIYRFRHAEVALLDEAARRIGALGAGRPVRQAISSSFRSVPELLSFVNAVSGSMVADEAGPDAWRFEETDRFPTPELAPGALRDGEPVLGLIAEASTERAAAAVADEIARLLSSGIVVRDRRTGARPVVPDDIAILFRARAGHQYFEDALDARGVSTYVYKGLGFFDAPEVQDLQALLGFLAHPESDLAAAAFLRSRFVRLSDQALADLAPALAQAILGTVAPSRAAAIGDVDRDLLTRVRAYAGRWVAETRVLPPGELVDLVVRESAYTWELCGRRLDQARENVKKVRSLVRRIESRGYTTFDRLASFFETLRAGDDSNAVVEARGSVSLMTIHAAKGLEFPVVFVVNMHAPGRGRAGGFTVIERGADGEPEVTFGATEGTALEDRRDNEELRRLLYVAVTRARDRLYLASAVKEDGRPLRQRRSLASLLPAQLLAAFGAAAVSNEPVVSWESPAGTFTFRCCRPASEPALVARESSIRTEPAAVEPIEPLQPSTAETPYAAGPIVSPAVEAGSSLANGRPEGPLSDSESDRFVGTVVHRLMQHRADPAAADETLAATIEALSRNIDPLDPEDHAARVAAAIRAFRRLAGHPDLVALLTQGECRYEVPFSFRLPEQAGAIVRGVIDCLVESADGVVTVVEFKTGRPRPEHAEQAALYARAAGAILGREPVAVRVFYPEGD